MLTFSKTSMQAQEITELPIIGASILGMANERRRWPHE